MGGDPPFNMVNTTWGCYGNIMSRSNKFVWDCLGQPSPDVFKDLAAQPDSMDLEGGFLLCTIGKLVIEICASNFRKHAASVAQWMSTRYTVFLSRRGISNVESY